MIYKYDQCFCDGLRAHKLTSDVIMKVLVVICVVFIHVMSDRESQWQ